MEPQKRVLPASVLMEEYRELLRDERIQTLPLVITGSSMSPFLIHGRDTVFLSRLTRPVRVGDALLYRRDSGQYVFHRVYRIQNGTYTMVGDAQTVLEPGIRPDQVIAIMTAAVRKGKRLEPGSFWWEFFEKIWIRSLRLRRPARKLFGIFARMRKH